MPKCQLWKLAGCLICLLALAVLAGEAQGEDALYHPYGYPYGGYPVVREGIDLLGEDAPNPPYGGTVFIDPDIITQTDPTALQNVTDAGRGDRVMYDRRVEDWITVSAYLFDARYDDGLAIEIQVNPEFGSVAAAMAEAEKYGRVVGQLPRVLRSDVNHCVIHKGRELLGGGSGGILIHTEHAEWSMSEGYLEEELAHEAGHASLDSTHAQTPDWLVAQTADGNFISDYARDHPEREDIAESFLSWLALRHRSARISRPYERAILETIPNRIAYFDRYIEAHPPARHPVTQDHRQVLDFAHFANSNSITSDLVLVNTEAVPAHPAVYFYDSMGEPLDPETVVDMAGNLEVREDGALSARTGIEPLGELTISTHGRGELVAGSVTVFSDILRSNPWGEPAGDAGRFGGFLRFHVQDLGAAGVGASAPVNDAIFPAQRREGGINTGAAVRNLEAEPMTLTCHLTQGGSELESVDIRLEGNGQKAQFIDELFQETDLSDFVGSVRCIAPEGERFTGLALEVDTSERVFTTLPVVPVVNRN